ncbi:hypothetical protein [Rosenbergiella australiborealis]|uniref:hypothetical protein n=1 Tax=Rosenbergiella australiborealis TaxID=1544696 RepID=UPI001F4E2C78|nr:hypothetical protein [Rosenbergiella australiborealis]
MDTLIGVLMIAIPLLVMAFFIVKDEIEDAKNRKELRNSQEELAKIKAQRLADKFNLAASTIKSVSAR